MTPPRKIQVNKALQAASIPSLAIHSEGHVVLDGTPLPITGGAYRLLIALAARLDRGETAVSQKSLATQLWPEATDPNKSLLTERRKLFKRFPSIASIWTTQEQTKKLGNMVGLRAAVSIAPAALSSLPTALTEYWRRALYGDHVSTFLYVWINDEKNRLFTANDRNHLHTKLITDPLLRASHALRLALRFIQLAEPDKAQEQLKEYENCRHYALAINPSLAHLAKLVHAWLALYRDERPLARTIVNSILSTQDTPQASLANALSLSALLRRTHDNELKGSSKANDLEQASAEAKKAVVISLATNEYESIAESIFTLANVEIDRGLSMQDAEQKNQFKVVENLIVRYDELYRWCGATLRPTLRVECLYARNLRLLCAKPEDAAQRLRNAFESSSGKALPHLLQQKAAIFCGNSQYPTIDLVYGCFELLKCASAATSKTHKQWHRQTWGDIELETLYQFTQDCCQLLHPSRSKNMAHRIAKWWQSFS